MTDIHTFGTVGTVEPKSLFPADLQLSRPETSNGTVGTVENLTVPTVPDVIENRDSCKPAGNNELRSTVPTVPTVPTCYLHELLTAAGIVFRIDGERLIAGPVELLTDEISNEIRNHKPALMAAVQLAEWQDQWAAISGAQDDIPCTCGGTCDGVEPNADERTKYGCPNDRTGWWCCVRAWVCRECKRRLAFRSPATE